MRILIAGEGKTELGYWSLQPEHRTSEKIRDERGLIDAFLSKYRTDGWTIVDGLNWRQIPKYTARRSNNSSASSIGPEGKTVLGLLLRAEERKCDAVVFVRDRDDEPMREKEIEAAVEMGAATFAPRVAGGIAAQAIESWLLSLKNEKGAERHGDPKDVLRDKFGVESLADKVAIVVQADVDDVRQDARSLLQWLARVRAILETSSS
jgi:hypothetical protein